MRDAIIHRTSRCQCTLRAEMQIGIRFRIFGLGEAQRFDGKSTALKRRAASASRTESMVRLATLIIVGAGQEELSFDHFRHFEIAGAGLRCVRERRLIPKRRDGHIGAQRGGFVRIEQHLCHGFHGAGIDLVELVDVLQNVVEVGLELRHLRFRKIEVREAGHVAYLIFGNLHASAFFREAL
jgi:hypothetical protein